MVAFEERPAGKQGGGTAAGQPLLRLGDVEAKVATTEASRGVMWDLVESKNQ